MSFICPTSIQSRSLWIGEIGNWMDEKYISNNFLHYGYKVKSVKIIRILKKILLKERKINIVRCFGLIFISLGNQNF